MADQSRLEDLRRLVEKDPAAIAFARLTEEYRRAGEYHRAVERRRAELAIHQAAGAMAPNDPDLESAVKELNDEQPSGRLPDTAALDSAERTIAVLDQWLSAIHVARSQRRS